MDKNNQNKTADYKPQNYRVRYDVLVRNKKLKYSSSHIKAPT